MGINAREVFGAVPAFFKYLKNLASILSKTQLINILFKSATSLSLPMKDFAILPIALITLSTEFSPLAIIVS